MNEPFDYYDISPEISEGLAVWPGDTAFQRKILMDFNKGDHYALSTMTTTGHLGAHADAPSHYASTGDGISKRDLKPYFGPCQVISLPPSQRIRILPEDLGPTPIQAPRVLFKTQSFTNPNHWNTDFRSLSPELIYFLAEHKVTLVGIDTPSVDPFEDKELKSHSAIFEKNISILEGLVLDRVSDGLYFLIALPLKILNADASPVRAILVKDPTVLKKRDSL